MLPHRLSVLFALLSIGAHGQWLSYPDTRTLRTKDGKPNFTAAAPRTAGNPDLSGVWELDPTPRSEPKRVNQIRQSQAQIASILRGEFREKAVGVFVDFDLPAQHAGRIA